MINEINVIGSKETTLHDFNLVQTGMDLLFSGGSYVQNNTERFTSDLGAVVTIPSPASDTHYELWLSEGGLTVLSRTSAEEFGTVLNPIDRLAWFLVPASVTTLDNVEINYVRMVNEDGSEAHIAKATTA